MKKIHYIYKAVKYSNGKSTKWLDMRENIKITIKYNKYIEIISK